MTTPESPEEVASRVIEALVHGQVIDYVNGTTDKEYPEVMWAIFGLPLTGEIAVVARVGDLRLGKAAPSTLLVPHMEERVYGIDVSDQMLANELSEALWAEQAERLIAAALRRRGH